MTDTAHTIVYKEHRGCGKYSLLFLFVISVIFYAFFLQSPQVMAASLVVLIGFLVVVYVAERKIRKSDLSLLLFASILLLPGLLKLDHGLSAFFYYIMELALILAAVSMIRKPHAYYFALRTTLYIFLIIVFFGLWKFRGYHEPLSYFVEGSSQNGIPSYLIIILIAYLYASVVLRGKMPLIPACLSLVVSYFGEGRGSMVVSLLIVGLCILYALINNQESTALSKAKKLCTALLVGFMFAYAQEVYNIFVSGTKLSVGLVDSHRLNILMSYVESLTAYGVVIGQGYENTIISEQYNGNPHIAYIRLHSFFGFFALMFVCCSPFLVYMRKGIKARFFLFSLLCLSLLRALTEPVLFPTYMDFFYYSSLLLLFGHGRQVPEGNKYRFH